MAATQFGTVGAPGPFGGGNTSTNNTSSNQLYQLPDGTLITQQQYQQMMTQQQWTVPPSQQAQFPPKPASEQVAPVVRVNGRFVASPEEIKPSEVAMDGSVTIFPLSDYTCIYAKQWDANGNIQTVKYVPVVEGSVVTEQNDISVNTEAIMERLGSIEQKLEKIEKQRPYYKKPYNKNQNKQPKEG